MRSEKLDVLVQRLEKYAERHMTRYKLSVVCLGLLGYAYLILLLAFIIYVPTSLSVWIARSIYVGTFVNELGYIVCFVSLLSAILVLLPLTSKLPKPRGINLSREVFPEIYEVIDKMRVSLKAPSIHRVLIDDSFNASIQHVSTFGILGKKRRYLVVGAPLMQALTPTQFAAVIAHEYAHISGTQGIVSIWIYQLRETWNRIMNTLDHESRWQNIMLSSFFSWYSPYFEAYSFVYTRCNRSQP